MLVYSVKFDDTGSKKSANQPVANILCLKDKIVKSVNIFGVPGHIF